jgi:hypothetical protein
VAAPKENGMNVAEKTVITTGKGDPSSKES